MIGVSHLKAFTTWEVFLVVLCKDSLWYMCYGGTSLVYFPLPSKIIRHD